MTQIKCYCCIFVKTLQNICFQSSLVQSSLVQSVLPNITVTLHSIPCPLFLHQMLISSLVSSSLPFEYVYSNRAHYVRANVNCTETSFSLCTYIYPRVLSPSRLRYIKTDGQPLSPSTIHSHSKYYFPMLLSTNPPSCSPNLDT